jgi:hypothetical protein
MKRTSDVERAIERVFGAFEVADANTDLSERCERDTKTVRRPRLLLQIDASLRKGERLLVPMLHQSDVRLVATYRRQDIERFDNDRQSFSLSQSRHGFVEPAFLRPGNTRQRMNHREVPSIASRMKGGRGLGDVLAHDRHLADLSIAEAELVMGKSDGA